MRSHITTYLLAPGILFIFATLLYYLHIFNALMFPNPLNIIEHFFTLIFSQELYTHLLPTLARVLLGTTLSIFVGIPFGLLFGFFQTIKDVFTFLVDFFRSIPATALFPLFILFFGIGNTSKIMLGAWVATFVLIINTSYGIKHANKSYLSLAKIYGVSKKYFFLHILLPGALPHIFSGVRVGGSFVLIVTIVAEMFLGSVNGLGYAILDMQLRYDIPRMYAFILITGIVGYVLNALFLLCEKRIIHWTGKSA